MTNLEGRMDKLSTCFHILFRVNGLMLFKLVTVDSSSNYANS